MGKFTVACLVGLALVGVYLWGASFIIMLAWNGVSPGSPITQWTALFVVLALSLIGGFFRSASS